MWFLVFVACLFVYVFFFFHFLLGEGEWEYTVRYVRNVEEYNSK